MIIISKFPNMSSIDERLHQKVVTIARSPSKEEEMPIQSKPKQTLNGLSHNNQYKKLTTINYVFLICLVAQYFIIYGYIELDVQKDQKANKFLQLSIVWSIVGSVILLIQNNLMNEYYSLCHQRQHRQIHIFFAIAVYNIMPYTFLENITIQFMQEQDDRLINVKLNHILSILATFRSIYFLKNFIFQSQYMNPQSFRVGKFYGSQMGKYTTLRHLFKDYPFQFVGILFTLSIIAFSFSFRIAEQYQYRNSSSFTIYCNMVWMTMITMTSVGFGDFNCRTVLGRLLGSFCATWGVLIVSLMVAVLTHFFNMSQDESQSLKMLKRLQIKSDLRVIAANFIRQRLWRMWSNYKYKLSKRSRKIQRKLRLQFNILKNTDHKTNQYQTKLRLYNQMQNSFLNVLSRVQNLKDNNLLFMNYFTQNFYFQKPQNHENNVYSVYSLHMLSQQHFTSKQNTPRKDRMFGKENMLDQD